ncbi:hypothetical protein DPX18_09975 [Pediococcus acidilactici]|uniref:hypothetical protein n=1 Tax=Pediococcus acidilactici TaxID=1254 RepID=UPI0020CEB568|nr:hypothetical protein [Pediococcus acidilactici]MCQ0053566.1 hypothetical protein [Pediococcus acidilactici]
MSALITLDTQKQQNGVSEAFNIQELFNARVGDEQVPFSVKFLERGKAQQFEDGLVPFMSGFVGNLDDDGKVTAETGEPVSYTGSRDDIVGLGMVKMNLPGMMFPQEGYFYGFLGLETPDHSKRVSTFSVWFHVYNGNPDMFVNKEPFRSELQKELDRVEVLIEQTEGTLKAKLIEWEKLITDLISNKNIDLEQLESRIATVEGNLTILEDKIKADGLLTQAELESFLKINFYDKKTIDSNIEKASQNQVPSTLNMKRMARYMENGYLQGNCYTGNGRWLRTVSENNNMVKLIENDSDGNIIKSKELSLGHANWIDYDYDNGLLYISEFLRDDSNGKSLHSSVVYVLDYATLTIKDTIDLTNVINNSNKSIMSFSYDNVTDEYFVLTEENSKQTQLYQYNKTNNQLTELTLPVMGYNNTTNNQGVSAHNGYLYYIKYAPAAIFKFDKTGKLYGVYNVEHMVESRFFVGEIEQISPMFDRSDGAFLIGAIHAISTHTSTYAQSAYETNFITNLPTVDEVPSGKAIKETKYVNVDASTSCINGDGTSNRPFKDINEALELTNNYMYQNLTISVEDGTYPFVAFYNPSAFVTIIGKHGADSKVTIGGFRGRGINVKLQYVQIQNNNSIQNYDVRLEQSHLIMSGVTLLSDKYDSNLYAYNTRVTIGGCQFKAPIPLELRAESEIVVDPFATPAFKRDTWSVINPNQFVISSQRVTKIGSASGIALDKGQKATLSSLPYIIAQVVYQNNTYYLKAPLVNGVGSIQHVLHGLPNDANVNGLLNSTEIGITITADKIYVDHVTYTGIKFENTEFDSMTGYMQKGKDGEEMVGLSIDRIWSGC